MLEVLEKIGERIIKIYPLKTIYRRGPSPHDGEAIKGFLWAAASWDPIPHTPHPGKGDKVNAILPISYRINEHISELFF